MIKNSILFYYDNDHRLGNYFSNCADNAVSLLNTKPHIKQTHITNSNCNFAYIENVELPRHKEKSLFLIYSHGEKNSFYKSNDSTPFIHSTITCDLCLDGGLVYTNACSTGEEFGKNLSSKNASYFGYDKEISVYLQYERIFIECDNWGLYKLLEGETLIESRKQAKDKFNQKIDELYKISPIAAGFLEDAKDSIVIYGNISNKFI